jgi:uncharacterized small protein (DUF1192 family)
VSLSIAQSAAYFADIDSKPDRSDVNHMDLDELFAKRPGDPLLLLTRQDLDPLSVAELHERVAILEGELARVNQKIAGAVNHRASADALFKR